MVDLKTVKLCNDKLVKSRPLVAIVSGGTSGIGEHSALALAAAHSDKGKGLRLYIIGRNELSAKRIITECQKVCQKGDFRFVHANDLSLLKDVDRVCNEIIASEEHEEDTPRVDLLIMSHAHMAFEARNGNCPQLFYHI
jgi:NAD(P)-dependent dehydrogenase (short-subunit alcohol dehydrogenase family)